MQEERSRFAHAPAAPPWPRRGRWGLRLAVGGRGRAERTCRRRWDLLDKQLTWRSIDAEFSFRHLENADSARLVARHRSG